MIKLTVTKAIDNECHYFVGWKKRAVYLRQMEMAQRALLTAREKAKCCSFYLFICARDERINKNEPYLYI